MIKKVISLFNEKPIDLHPNCAVECVYEVQGVGEGVMGEKFKKAIAFVLENEGGYSNNPNDSGGMTNLGISFRFLRTLGEYSQYNDNHIEILIRNMTVETATEIYYKYFWLPNNYEEINDFQIVKKALDFSINAGAFKANSLLQRATKAVTLEHLTEDGIVGKGTLEQINKCDSKALLAAYISEIANYYRSLKKSIIFIQGWLKRAYKI